MASRPSRSIDPLRAGARLALLVGTGYLLVATSAPYVPPQSCVHPTETIMVAVTGSCGPAGTIVLESLENECGISVRNAPAVGLPNAGRFADFSGEKKVSLLTHDWALSGDIGFSGPADGGREVPPPSDAGAGADAGLVVVDGGSPPDAGDAAIYVPPPDASSAPPFTRRACKAHVLPTMPLRLVCNDDDSDAAAATCTAELMPS